VDRAAAIPEGSRRWHAAIRVPRLRGKLTCKELTLAIDEIAKAMQALVAPVGMVSDQVARVRALDAQVHDELRTEHGSRCRA
jgi:hypothetical protein